MTDLTTPEKRAALKPRGLPYAMKVAPYKHLLFRKLREGGTWTARRHLPNCKREFQRIGPETDYSYEEALTAALKWFKLEPGQTVAPSKLTLGLVLSSYLTYRLNETEERGAKSTKSLFNCHVFPHPIASRPVMHLKTADYQTWLETTADRLVQNHRHSDPHERRRLGRYSANTIWTFIEAALNRAAKTNKDLPREEWRAVEPLKGGETVSRPAFMSEQEMQRLVNVATDAFRDLVLGGALTGARVGELTNMKVRDIDFDEGIWHVSHSKTKRGRRPRYLDQPTLELLSRLCAGRRPNELVFVHRDGEPWRKRYQYFMTQAVKRAGLDPKINFYSIRHSYISNQIKAGVIPQVVAENCGTSIKQIEDFYGHFKPDEKRAQLARGAFQLGVPQSNVVTMR